jgi:O-antigen/teichoic acid export membrane protein
VGIQALRDRDDPGRDETPEERADRNLSELLQELRVAGIGVQVLFGFLLSLPFTNRFRVLDADQIALYTVTIVVAAAAIACLITPVAFHRMEFRRHEKARVVAVSHAVALVGLAAVALALSGSVALVMTMVHDGVVVPAVVAVIVGLFAGLWFVLPLATRRRHGER